MIFLRKNIKLILLLILILIVWIIIMNTSSYKKLWSFSFGRSFSSGNDRTWDIKDFGTGWGTKAKSCFDIKECTCYGIYSESDKSNIFSYSQTCYGLEFCGEKITKCNDWFTL
jgi:hypothetical protein